MSTAAEAPGLIQYACERCKTRFVLPPSQRHLGFGGRLKASGMAISRTLRYHEGLGSTYDGARRQMLAKMDDDAYQSFVQSFKFCHECRQFVCSECWSNSRKTCLGCFAKAAGTGTRQRPPFAPEGPPIPRPVAGAAALGAAAALGVAAGRVAGATPIPARNVAGPPAAAMPAAATPAAAMPAAAMPAAGRAAAFTSAAATPAVGRNAAFTPVVPMPAVLRNAPLPAAAMKNSAVAPAIARAPAVRAPAGRRRRLGFDAAALVIAAMVILLAVEAFMFLPTLGHNNGSGPSLVAQASASASPTDTPSPAAVIVPTDTPTPTPTPTATPTASPTDSPSPSPTAPPAPKPTAVPPKPFPTAISITCGAAGSGKISCRWNNYDSRGAIAWTLTTPDNVPDYQLTNKSRAPIFSGLTPGGYDRVDLTVTYNGHHYSPTPWNGSAG